MADDKLLAEWFWTDRWMGSRGFLLPQEARGIYREMLTQAWRRGARLPNDHEAIRRATGTTMKEWRHSWPVVEPFWRVDGDSLVNDTQQEVYADAQGRADRAVGRARAGAQARHKHSLSTAQAPTQVEVQAQLKHCPPSPISDLRSPKEQIQRDGAGEWEQFRAAYPGKGREGGYMAQQRFLAASESVGFDVLMAAVHRYAKSTKVREGFVVRLENWLERTMWIQEPDSPDQVKDEGLRLATEHLAKIDAERASRGR